MMKRMPEPTASRKTKKVNKFGSKNSQVEDESSNSFLNTTFERKSIKLDKMKVFPPIKISYLFFEILPEKFHKNYISKGEIGKGANGIVFKALHVPSQSMRAIKVINLPTNCENAYSPNEIKILRNLDHPNIVKIYEVCKEGDLFYSVTEFCEGGSLFERILSQGSFSEDLCKSLIYQVLRGLDYCHSKHIVHRDIKPENLLFDSNKNEPLLKIVDFDISAHFTDDSLNQICGSAYYIAPEILRGYYNEKVDIWSLGVIFYTLVVGKPPVFGETQLEILTQIKYLESIDFTPAENKLSAHGYSVLCRMLQVDPKLRASAPELLSSIWFQEHKEKKYCKAPMLNSTLKTLRNFRSHTFLQNLVYFYVTSCLVHKDEKHKLTVVFRELDSDNDGKLSHDELVQAFVLTGRSFDRSYMLVDKILSELKLDSSGITYNEFLVACCKKQELMNDESLRRAFDEWDIDRKGIISTAALKQTLKTGYFREFEKLEVNVFDDLEAETLDFEQFKKVMQKFVEDEKVSQSLTYG